MVTLRVLILGCAVLAWASCTASMLAFAYFVVRGSLNRSPGRSGRWIVRMNQYNAIYFSDELTPVGRKYRAKALKAMITFFSSASTFGVMTLIAAEMIKP